MPFSHFGIPTLGKMHKNNRIEIGIKPQSEAVNNFVKPSVNYFTAIDLTVYFFIAL